MAGDGTSVGAVGELAGGKERLGIGPRQHRRHDMTCRLICRGLANLQLQVPIGHAPAPIDAVQRILIRQMIDGGVGARSHKWLERSRHPIPSERLGPPRSQSAGRGQHPRADFERSPQIGERAKLAEPVIEDDHARHALVLFRTILSAGKSAGEAPMVSARPRYDD